MPIVLRVVLCLYIIMFIFRVNCAKFTFFLINFIKHLFHLIKFLFIIVRKKANDKCNLTLKKEILLSYYALIIELQVLEELVTICLYIITLFQISKQLVSINFMNVLYFKFNN